MSISKGLRTRRTTTPVYDDGRVCTGCRERKLWDDFFVNKQHSTGHMPRCKNCTSPRINNGAKIIRDKTREETIAAYGSCCACCGETESRFLTIDHMDGKGRQHRKEMNLPTSYTFYVWLRKGGYPRNFQCLCWNCNSGRYFNGGICPHQESR